MGDLANSSASRVLDNPIFKTHPLQTIRVEDSAELAAVRATPLKDIHSIGVERLPTASTSSWLSQFGSRIAATAPSTVLKADDETKGTASGDFTDFVLLAAFLSAIGHPEQIDALESAEQRRVSIYPGMDSCDNEQKKAGDPGYQTCPQQTKAEIALALFAWFKGDKAGAKARYDRASAHAKISDGERDYWRLNDGVLTADMGQDRFLVERAKYLAIAGSDDELTAALKAVSTYQAGASEYDHHVATVADVAQMLEVAGYERALFRAAYLGEKVGAFRSNNEFGYLFGALDASISRGAPVGAVRDEIRLMAALRDMHPEAVVGWHNMITVGLECRLAETFATEGQTDTARRLFDTTRQHLAGWPLSFYETELCLYRLAPRIGSDSAVADITAEMERKNKASQERFDAVAQAYAHGMGDAVWRTKENPFGRLVGATPRAWYYVDTERYQQMIVNSLELLKDYKPETLRGKRLTDIAVDAAGYAHLSPER
jgi:hypothetical protein